MPLFEVAILEIPNLQEEKDGEKEALIMPPTPILAKNVKHAGILAAMRSSDKIINPDRIEVLVRPFLDSTNLSAIPKFRSQTDHVSDSFYGRLNGGVSKISSGAIFTNKELEGIND